MFEEVRPSVSSVNRNDGDSEEEGEITRSSRPMMCPHAIKKDFSLISFQSLMIIRQSLKKKIIQGRTDERAEPPLEMRGGN